VIPVQLRVVTYVSQALINGDADLRRIIQVSDRHNRRNGITGALVYDGGHFAQILEGEPTALDGTLARIARDPRHTDMRIVTDDDADERLFGNWTMGAYNVSADEQETVALTDLRRDLLEHLAPEGRQGRLPHFVSFFRLCLNANREGAMPEHVVLEPPRFLSAG
jgi:hypothetical protein